MKTLRAKKTGYDEIQRFLEEAYGHSYNFFPNNYPHVWTKDTIQYENTFIIKEDGRIASLVRLFPLKLLINGVKIKVGGIGGVSTLYEHRGKGYMSTLMNAVIEQMKREKYPVSILWGDRHRYKNFGYENAGDSVVEICISARGFEKLKIEPAHAKRYSGEKEILKKIIESYNKHSIRKERSKEEFAGILTRQGFSTYYALKKDGFGYISIQGEFVAEYGGSPCIILGILKYLNKRFGTGKFLMHFPSYSLIPAEILQITSWWHNKISAGMIKIISLKDILQTYREKFKDRLDNQQEITFSIKEGESVIVKNSNGKIQIEEGKGENHVYLTEQEMVRLLFSSPDWFSTGGPSFKILKNVLPLEIFVWPLDHI
ncbi:MAG: GNAT family N-acetyltransferase [Candidatus Omnitrophica bacterium]|nr:GNAT family N-acetyltransferase [Candidatus Omnitrophota bacterium]